MPSIVDYEGFRPHYRIEALVRHTQVDAEDILEEEIKQFLETIVNEVEGICVFRVYPVSDYA